MADAAASADVRSTDALARFNRALVRFAEETDSALAEADGDLARLRMWLEREHPAYLEAEMRRAHARLEKAKEALRFKQNFRGPAGERQSVVDEQKAVKIAQAAMEELERKVRVTKRYGISFEQSVSLYRGGVQGLSTAISADIPTAVANIKQFISLLQQYSAEGQETKSEAVSRPVEDHSQPEGHAPVNKES